MVHKDETDPPRAQSAPQTQEAMSTKLNAEELAAKRYKDEHEPDAVINVSPFQWVRLGYTTAIREVAQPIADERDELRTVIEDILYWVDEGMPVDDMSTPIKDAERILAKYPKP